MRPSSRRVASIHKLANLWGSEFAKNSRLDVSQQWRVSDPDESDPDQTERIWDIYSLSYGSIGSQVGDPKELFSNFDLMFYKDVDGDSTIDSVLTFKRTHAGRKIVFLVSDGSSQGKRAMISKLADLLGKVGWYIEISGRPVQIMLSMGLRPIVDEQVVRDVLRKPLVWKGNGAYDRVITGLGTHEKYLFGRPRL